MRSTRRAPCAVLLIVSCVSIAAAQTPAPQPSGVPPNFSVQVWGDTVADFAGRVQQYFELRRRLESGLPPLVLTDHASDIITAELTLAQRRLVSERLTRLGALVVDAPVEVFSSHVADAYLDLKAAGKL